MRVLCMCIHLYSKKQIFVIFSGSNDVQKLDRNTKYRICDMNVANVTLRHTRHNYTTKNRKLPPIVVIHEKEQFLKYPRLKSLKLT